MSLEFVVGLAAGASIVISIQFIALLMLLTSIDNTLQDLLEEYRGRSDTE